MRETAAHVFCSSLLKLNIHRSNSGLVKAAAVTDGY